MTQPVLRCDCISATPFGAGGTIDESILRAYLRRFVDARLGVYLGSGGNGEGHALSNQELRRIYEIGVDECKGKVPVHANLPERHTAAATCEQAQIAIDAGIEVLELYHLAGWHGMKPTDAELIAYFDDVMSKIQHRVVLAVNSIVGYMPKASVVAEICGRHEQIEAIRLSQPDDLYLLALKDTLKRPMVYRVQFNAGTTTMLALGATGLFGSEVNILPRTFRLFLDQVSSRPADAAMTYAQLRRFSDYCWKWGPAGARWIKMAMKVLHLPGGEGGLRRPYLMPAEDELRKFADGLFGLGIAEIDDLAAKKSN